jgi:E3 ubiquitin-protein ligase BRE1
VPHPHCLPFVVTVDSAAEARADALEKPFSIFNEEHPDVIAHMKAEAEARQQLTVVTSQLERYQATYGEPSPDIQQLEVQLRLKTEELRKLKMQEAQRNEVRASAIAKTLKPLT